MDFRSNLLQDRESVVMSERDDTYLPTYEELDTSNDSKDCIKNFNMQRDSGTRRRHPDWFDLSRACFDNDS